MRSLTGKSARLTQQSPCAAAQPRKTCLMPVSPVSRRPSSMSGVSGRCLRHADAATPHSLPIARLVTAMPRALVISPWRSRSVFSRWFVPTKQARASCLRSIPRQAFPTWLSSALPGVSGKHLFRDRSTLTNMSCSSRFLSAKTHARSLKRAWAKRRSSSARRALWGGNHGGKRRSLCPRRLRHLCW